MWSRITLALSVLMNPERYNILSKITYDYHQMSFSQEGEDMVLARLFVGKNHGFYVDVGAHHPQRFSNTYKLKAG